MVLGRRQWHLTPVLLPGKSHGLKSPGRLQSMEARRAGHDWETSLSLSCTREGNGNPLQCSYLENPRDGGTWWVAVYGVAKSRTWLSDWTELNWSVFLVLSPSWFSSVSTAYVLFLIFTITLQGWNYSFCITYEGTEAERDFAPPPKIIVICWGFKDKKIRPLPLWTSESSDEADICCYTYACVCTLFSHVQLFVTLWTITP